MGIVGLVKNEGERAGLLIGLEGRRDRYFAANQKLTNHARTFENHSCHGPIANHSLALWRLTSKFADLRISLAAPIESLLKRHPIADPHIDARFD